MNRTGKDPVSSNATPSGDIRSSAFHLTSALHRALSLRWARLLAGSLPVLPDLRTGLLCATALGALAATSAIAGLWHMDRMAAPLAPTAAIPERPKTLPRLHPHRFMRNPLHGLASWYGEVWQGRRTASGELFDDAKMTACHRTLPFGTMVRVTNTRTSRSVVVKINDRGTLFPGRIIDLSSAAARELGMLRHGLDDVRVEVVGKAPIRPAPVEVAQARPPASTSGDE